MNSDLIFHIVSRRKWKQLTNRGYFSPEELNENNQIECVPSRKLNEYLNTHYSGRKNLLILVIDSSRVLNKITRDKDTGRVYVDSKINIDAILDKIRIDANNDGTFDISVLED
jgi:uncharacterized protein (DUF952 family)